MMLVRKSHVVTVVTATWTVSEWEKACVATSIRTLKLTEWKVEIKLHLPAVNERISTSTTITNACSDYSGPNKTSVSDFPISTTTLQPCARLLYSKRRHVVLSTKIINPKEPQCSWTDILSPFGNFISWMRSRKSAVYFPPLRHREAYSWPWHFLMQ